MKNYLAPAVALVCALFVMSFQHVQAESKQPASLLNRGRSDPQMPHASDHLLNTLTADKIATLRRADLISVYLSRISTDDPNRRWLNVVDADIRSRPDSTDLLMEILKRPRHRYTRSGLWHWLTKHPSYAGGRTLLAESINLFKLEDKNWNAVSISSLASLIVEIGTPEQIGLLDLMQEGGGLGVDLAKQRYLNRTQNKAGQAAIKTGSATLDQTSPLTSSKDQGADMARRPLGVTDSMQRMIIITSIIAALGLLWLLLKRRS